MRDFPTIIPFGDQCILLQWQPNISTEIHQKVMEAKRFLNENYASSILEMVPAYASLAVYLKEGISAAYVIGEFKNRLHSNQFSTQNKAYLIHIPVCYGGDFGPDLIALSEKLSISVDEIIKMHTTPQYLTYFLGFLPGFPYLGGLNPKIAFPRKATPSHHVAAGSVGIAGNQTGVYTTNSPGGWNIIGRSPLQFFNVSQQQPSLIQSGDFVNFYAISISEFEEIKQQIAQRKYRVRKEEVDV